MRSMLEHLNFNVIQKPTKIITYFVNSPLHLVSQYITIYVVPNYIYLFCLNTIAHVAACQAGSAGQCHSETAKWSGVWNEINRLFSVKYKLYSVQCTVYSVHCTVYSI